MSAGPPIVAQQSGVFSREQAYAAGFTERQVRRRLAAGRWQVVAGLGLAAATVDRGPWQLAWAVHLTWPEAVVSHELAGALWRFPLPPPSVGTATLATDRKVKRAGLRAVRRKLLPGQVSRLQGLPVTDPTRTAVDLLAELPWDQARNLFAWLVTRGWLNCAELELWIGTRGATAGTAQLRRMVKVGRGGSLSAAEDRFHELLAGARITGWQANAPIVVAGQVIAVADVLFPGARVVVEIDGWSALALASRSVLTQ